MLMSALQPGELRSVVRPPEGRYRAFFEHSPDICIVLEPASGTILESNRMVHAVLGYAPQELIGRPIVSLAHPNSQQSASSDWQALAGKFDLRNANLQVLRADGATVALCVSATPIRDERGRVLFGLTVWRLDSPSDPGRRELQRCRRQLRTLAYEISVAEERERRRIAAGLHDELGQLLAVARLKLGQLGELTQDAPSRMLVEELRALVALAARATRSTTFELSPHVLHKLGVGPAIERVAQRMERLYGLRVRVKMESPLPLCEETLVVVFRVVRELLYNVQKHAQATTVTVSLRRLRQRVVIVVQDDGVGFEVGQQASEFSPSRGFGLDSVGAQLQAIGGQLEVESSVGAGTTVRVSAPLAVREAGKR
jgi:PAS domain S-box-containing protein